MPLCLIKPEVISKIISGETYERMLCEAKKKFEEFGVAYSPSAEEVEEKFLEYVKTKKLLNPENYEEFKAMRDRYHEVLWLSEDCWYCAGTGYEDPTLEDDGWRENEHEEEVFFPCSHCGETGNQRQIDLEFLVDVGKRKKCATCDGSGWVMHPENQEYKYLCPKCYGVGRVWENIKR